MSISKKIVDDFVANGVSFITTVPCKQLAGVIDEVEAREEIYHIPSNKEDEGMGLCAGAFMGGKRPAIIMQNTAIGVTVNTLVTLTQFYRMPLPMLISYRGELSMPVFKFYPETAFGGDFETEAVYRDIEVQCLIKSGGLEACWDDPEGVVTAIEAGTSNWFASTIRSRPTVSPVRSPPAFQMKVCSAPSGEV